MTRTPETAAPSVPGGVQPRSDSRVPARLRAPPALGGRRPARGERVGVSVGGRPNFLSRAPAASGGSRKTLCVDGIRDRLTASRLPGTERFLEAGKGKKKDSTGQ